MPLKKFNLKVSILKVFRVHYLYSNKNLKV